MKTSAKEMSDALMNLVDQVIDGDEEFMDEVAYDPKLFGDGSTQTYSELGILTTDAGFVFRTADGSEYQVTVVKSK